MPIRADSKKLKLPDVEKKTFTIDKRPTVKVLLNISMSIKPGFHRNDDLITELIGSYSPYTLYYTQF